MFAFTTSLSSHLHHITVSTPPLLPPLFSLTLLYLFFLPSPPPLRLTYTTLPSLPSHYHLPSSPKHRVTFSIRHQHPPPPPSHLPFTTTSSLLRLRETLPLSALALLPRATTPSSPPHLPPCSLLTSIFPYHPQLLTTNAVHLPPPRISRDVNSNSTLPTLLLYAKLVVISSHRPSSLPSITPSQTPSPHPTTILPSVSRGVGHKLIGQKLPRTTHHRTKAYQEKAHQRKVRPKNSTADHSRLLIHSEGVLCACVGSFIRKKGHRHDCTNTHVHTWNPVSFRDMRLSFPVQKTTRNFKYILGYFCIYACIDVSFMHEWIDGWVEACMHAQMYVCMCVCMYVCVRA